MSSYILSATFAADPATYFASYVAVDGRILRWSTERPNAVVMDAGRARSVLRFFGHHACHKDVVAIRKEPFGGAQ